MKNNYQHYKSGIVTVIGIGAHTESNERLVAYYDEDGIVHFTPETLFFESVVYNGKLVKRILAQNKINKNVKSVRVATTITGPNGTIAEAGEILTVVRDYNRIGQPQVLRNSDGRHICDVDSYTAKQHCIPIN